MNKIRLGFAMCGSFCTHSAALDALRELVDYYDVTPIVSDICTWADTRFGTSKALLEELEALTGHAPITDIVEIGRAHV